MPIWITCYPKKTPFPIGNHNDWYQTESPSITYHNLEPGDYRFEVRGENAFGIESDNTATYEFTVEPFWYETLWFSSLMVLLGIGGVGLFFRNRIERERKYSDKLKHMVDEQTREILEINDSLSQINMDMEEKNLSLKTAYEEAQIINDNLIKTNQLLENRSDQLREALEKNKEILGITAHDLKNPLSGIIGLAELVLTDLHDGAQIALESAASNLPMLKDEAERMLKIIKDLLDKHREGEEIILNKEKKVLGDIVASVVRWNTKQAQNKEISIHYETEITAIVEIDVMSIQRVLDNYVSNAVKYSPLKSNIWINVYACREENDEGSFVRVAVRDEGPGLTDDDKKKVFGKMQRLSAKPTAGEHSTGLGLFIVKQLVEAHDGEVGVESVHGEGATFWFTLPLCLKYLSDAYEEHIHERATLPVDR